MTTTTSLKLSSDALPEIPFVINGLRDDSHIVRQWRNQIVKCLAPPVKLYMKVIIFAFSLKLAR